MAIIPNARTTTLANLMTDTKALVVSKDVFDICTIGTDFSFDALNPLGYVAQAVPANDAALPAMSLLSSYISSPGAGGANGTFNLALQGAAGGAGAAGTFTVAGGAVTDSLITAIGAGYTANPGLSVAASAGLAGATVLPLMANIVNVARDAQPALGRTKRVGLYPQTYAQRPTFNGKGFDFVYNTNCGLVLAKGGLHPGKVCEPFHEGFLDVLEIITFKADGFPQAGTVSPYNVTGGGGGFQLDGSRAPVARETNAVLGAPIAPGELYTLAKRVRFDVNAGTSTIIGYLGHGGVLVATAQTAGKATAAYGTTTGGSAIVGSQSGSAGTAWHGDIYHVYREYIGISGRTDADVLEVVKRVHERAVSRYA
jgi:hypothetical protein